MRPGRTGARVHRNPRLSGGIRREWLPTWHPAWDPAWDPPFARPVIASGYRRLTSRRATTGHIAHPGRAPFRVGTLHRGYTAKTMRRLGQLLMVVLLASCQATGETAISQVSTTTTGAPSRTAELSTSTTSGLVDSDLPPVTGPDPSYRVAAFYYPWYRNADLDGVWEPWGNDVDFGPPGDIASDFYPVLGPYSSAARAVVAQHFAWLRRARVGVIISSWWGQGDYTDRIVPLLLEQGERYGIKVAFHVEPRDGRTADSVVADVRYIYEEYGDSPAFFRTDLPSRRSVGDSKGLFFLWAAESSNFREDPIEPGYWLEAMDNIHALPDSAIVIANTLNGAWVDLNHFDGLYNYATQDLEETRGFGWGAGIPDGAWYVPSVLPGFSAVRIGYPSETQLERLDGATYDDQWAHALGVGIRPEMVTITSFNEWLEGSQIEPARPQVDNGSGYEYLSYGSLGEEGYLDRTAEWVQRFSDQTWPEPSRAQVRVSTTSDWTLVRLQSGGLWMRPSISSVSDAATYAGFRGDHLALNQTLADAEAGRRVEMILDISFASLDPDSELEFQIGRGHIGATEVEIYLVNGDGPVSVGAFSWGGINPGPENLVTVRLPSATLVGD